MSRTILVVLPLDRKTIESHMNIDIPARGHTHVNVVALLSERPVTFGVIVITNSAKINCLYLIYR